MKTVREIKTSYKNGEMTKADFITAMHDARCTEVSF